MSKSKDFINYNRLDRNKRLFFATSGLDQFIRIATKMLSKRLMAVETYDLEKPYFSEKDIVTLNSMIRDLLELIVKHNDTHLDPSIDLDARFDSPSERDSFPYYLHISRWKAKKVYLIGISEKNQTKIESNQKVSGKIYSMSAFKDIPAAKEIRYGSNSMTETETRAVGVLYFLSKVWKSIQEQNKKKGRPDSFATVIKAVSGIFFLIDKSELMIKQSTAAKGRSAQQYAIIKKIYKSDPTEKLHKLTKRATNLMKKRGLKPLSSETVVKALRRLKKEG